MQDKTAPRRNVDRSTATQAALMDAAKSLFVEKGYAETGTPEIVKNAGVTRGALYHHFDGKEGLLRAILVREAAAISEEIRATASVADTPRAALMSGARGYFAAMKDVGRQRLMLRDGPAVLGPKAMAEIDREAGIGGLAQGLAALMGDSGPSEAVLAALAEILSAGFDRVAQLETRQEDSLAALALIFDGLAPD